MQRVACHISAGQRKWTAEQSDGGPQGRPQDVACQCANSMLFPAIFPPIPAAGENPV
jgi:hypothetical protein